MNTASTQVKEARKKAGWTQAQMAQELGVALVTVQKWEQGINPMHSIFWEKLLLNERKT